MKVVFLDVDGVLNTTRAMIGYKQRSIFEVEDSVYFDPIAVKFLQTLQQKTGAKFVLSSTWRFHVYGERLVQFGRNLGIEFFDITPRVNAIRGVEIKQWLDRFPEVTHYVIIDDDSDMLTEQIPHLVKTDTHDGLGYENMAKSLELLGVDLIDSFIKDYEMGSRTGAVNTEIDHLADELFAMAKECGFDLNTSEKVKVALGKSVPYQWIEKFSKLCRK